MAAAKKRKTKQPVRRTRQKVSDGEYKFVLADGLEVTLNSKEFAFVQRYLRDFDALKAAQEVLGGDKSVTNSKYHKEASTLLRNQRIQMVVQTHLEEFQFLTGLSKAFCAGLTMKLIRKAEDAGDYKAAITGARDLAKMAGHMHDQVQHTHVKALREMGMEELSVMLGSQAKMPDTLIQAMNPPKNPFRVRQDRISDNNVKDAVPIEVEAREIPDEPPAPPEPPKAPPEPVGDPKAPIAPFRKRKAAPPSGAAVTI